MADEFEQVLHGGQPANRALEQSARDRLIVDLATRGVSVGQIADHPDVRLSTRQVSRVLAEAATLVRSQTSSIVAQKFHMQLERLERLYGVVELAVQQYERSMLASLAPTTEGGAAPPPPEKFDDRPFRVLVMIMERQAKLLGMDRGTTAMKDRSPTQWLSEAPLSEVVDYAKQLKMNIPTQFET
jgi:hypothetical protein